MRRPPPASSMPPFYERPRMIEHGRAVVVRAMSLLFGVTVAVACAGEPLPEDRAFGPERPSADVNHPTSIHTPEGLGRLRATLPAGLPGATVNGEPKEVVVPCLTCHGNAASIAIRAGTTPDKRFHANVEVVHGNLPCLSCHADRERDRLHLANGDTLAFDDVMTLCAQCHGPQFRDYQHGAHGGMNGYWDRRRGARTRNNCVDCHQPHAPAYRAVVPAFPPRDRYLGTTPETH